MATFMDSGDLAHQDVKAKIENGQYVGIFTSAAVSPGIRIINEEPLMVFDGRNGDPTEDDLYEALQDLTPGEREYFSCLRPSDEMDPCRLSSIWKAHCFKLEDGSQLYLQVISIIQHSCSPNAIADWNSKIRCLTITVIRHLEVNTPITISYVNPLLPLQERFLSLRDDFGVTCVCPRCAPVPQLRLFQRCLEEEYKAWERILQKDKEQNEIEDLLAEYNEIEQGWRCETRGCKAYQLQDELAHLHERCAGAITYGPSTEEELRMRQIEDHLERRDELLEEWRSNKYGATPLKLIHRIIALQNGDLVTFSLTYRRACQYAYDEGDIQTALRFSDEEIWDVKRFFGNDSQRMSAARRVKDGLVEEANRRYAVLHPQAMVRRMSKGRSEITVGGASRRVSENFHGYERRSGKVLRRRRRLVDREVVEFY